MATLKTVCSRAEKSDGAGVDAARCGLELREQLHGPHLGRTGHGTAGKEGSKDVVIANVGAQFAGDG